MRDAKLELFYITFIIQTLVVQRGKIMRRKLTISIDEQLYNALYHIVGKRKISRFIEDLVKPKVINEELELAYQQMAEDSLREEEALQWSEGTFEEFHNETW